MRIHKHTSDYVILLLALLIALVFFAANASYPTRQYGIVIAMGGVYVAWGIFHHLRNHDFHLKIVVEYVVVAILGVLILRGAIFH